MRVLISIVKAGLGMAGVVAYTLGFTLLLNSMAIVVHLADGLWFGMSIISNDNAIAVFFTAVACGFFGWGMWHVERLVKPKMIERQTI